MFKFLLSILSGAAIGVASTLFAVSWQEEGLLYELGEVAQFGDITYQNLRIKNEGWNPATNVSIGLDVGYIAKENIKASPKFELDETENSVGGYKRIRRDEVVTLSFAFKGEPLTNHTVQIKSDRSIATEINLSEESGKTDWAFVLFIITIAFFFIGMFSAIAIPAYNGYIKRAKEIQEQLNASNK